MQLGGGLVAEKRLEVAQQALLELAPLQVGQLHPDARHRLAEALAHVLERVVELLSPELLDAEPLRDACEELVQRAVRDLAPQARVDDLVDRTWTDQPVHEPDRRAVGERLELGDAEVRFLAQFLQHERMREARRPFEGAERAVELALPTVCLRQRVRGLLVDGDERGKRTQPLPIGRSLLDGPGEGREWSPHRGTAHLVLGKEAANLVPEWARLARPTLVVRRFAHEIEPPRGACAGRVEEVAVSLDRVRPRQARAA